MIVRTMLAVVFALALAGCQTAAQLAQRDEERCAARGYKPDSDDFKNCLVQLETERKLRVDRRHQEMVERSANPLAR
jgi:hypothetical protein